MILIMGTVDEDCESLARTGTVRGGKDTVDTVKQIVAGLLTRRQLQKSGITMWHSENEENGMVQGTINLNLICKKNHR